MSTAAGYGAANLPLGVVRPPGVAPRVCARLGDDALDLAALAGAGLLDEDRAVFEQPALNAFLARGRETWSHVRAQLRALADEDRVPPDARHAIAQSEALLPIEVADYVDFYSSLQHATNLGRLFRPGGDPLLPNWRHLPIGYHGRAGTVVPSGTPVRRPHGQRKPPDADAPVFGPSVRLDVELEIGFVVGVPSALGEPVPVERALDHVFGLVIVNDWSARDIQAWEYQPLGPFLGKSFATSIGRWVVPLEALEPFRVARPAPEPEPLEYLREAPWAYDVTLELELNGEVVSRTNASNLYWSIAQQVAHMTSNGASLRTGDLLASGTISGDDPGTQGSLIELTSNGAEPLELAGGDRRTFLEDGDEVVMRGVAGSGDDAVALDEVRGRIEPAR